MGAGDGKGMQAQGAGQWSRSAGGVDALDQGGQATPRLPGFLVQNRPEFLLQRHGGLMAGEGEGAFL